MLYHKQRIRHDPENGIYGDCHRTAIACLLDKQVEDVPHFGEHFMDSDKFNKAVADYLLTQGMRVFTTPYHGETPLHEMLKAIGHYNPDCYYLLTGQSPRNVNHVVVCRGGRIIHDPHFDGGFITGPAQPDGYYWVDVLTPMLEG